ncbi:hypothetical protein [Candidatus Ichthyocystis sparus]|uniref:hypothetical protein n=1 Tax=Candidatus Ichthyocystis sparus TaxID=1561004 RepID=UPI000B83E020|nr:hypothetical protein [Candidatus Ichthyocystis sparus]
MHQDSRASGEGTSYAAQSSDSDRDSALMDSNEITIRALLDSIEAPRLHGIEAPQLQVVPAVAVEGNTTYWQNPSAPPYTQDPSTSGQSAIDYEAGFMLSPYLASALGMQPGERLFRGMFHSTQWSHVVLGMINQLSEIQKDLLRNQELERAGVVTQGEISLSFKDTTALIATNEESLQALMASIEAPAETTPPTVVDSSSNSETELEERTLAKLEEGKMKCRVPNEEEATRIRSPDPVGAGILRSLMEEEEARYRGKVLEMKSKSEDTISQKIIVVEKSEEERANKLAALEEIMIRHSEVKVTEKFLIQGEKEEDVGILRAKIIALSKAKHREREKVAEAKSGSRVVIGSIPENIMKEIEIRSAAIVKERVEKERIKAAEKAEKKSREAELREAKAKRKAEMRVEKAKLEEEARAERKAAKEELGAVKKKKKEYIAARVGELLAQMERKKEEEKDKDKQGKQ